jgi:AcrR family transcriptional regulator
LARIANLVTTRERILLAATAEFAEHGLAGARVARIATAAAANKERIYHYFGRKDQLFDAVLAHAMEEIRAAEPFRADDLGSYVEAMLAFHRERPELVRLLLAEGEVRRPQQRRAHYASRVEAVRRAQQAGAVRSDVDARFVVFIVLATVVAAEAMPELSALILDGADPQDGIRALLAGPGSPDSCADR